MYGHAAKFITRHGIEATAEMIKYEISHLRILADVIEREKIDCDLTLTRSFDVYFDQEVMDKVRHGVEPLLSDSYQQGKYEFMKDADFRFPTTDHPLTEEDLKETKVKGAKGFVSFPAGHIWPYKFISGLLEIAVSKGLNLQTNTPVLEISPQRDEEGYWKISTGNDRGVIRARKVILATNAYTSALAPEYAKAIVPCKGLCCHIVIPQSSDQDADQKLPPRLTNTYVTRHGSGAGGYLIPRPDGSVIVGGTSHTFTPFLEQWHNNPNDDVLIDAAKQYLDGYMQRTFVGWENSGAYSREIWTGVMGYSADSLPHIGVVPSKEGQLILAGFNGHGMPVCFLAGKAIAQMALCDNVIFEDTGLPRVYKTTSDRLETKYNDTLQP
ncbi:FAD dependent oxidoreductase superfamily protein [Arthroderma uncinatum]|uniref:FAD dependent oxidoreductase superfamily protein n=1 Tax=Arthroderma uncinatum TaxID=74035 RepID=UPI00144A5E24|nr:FAD dependent oxidoreductase superfamily protein [Arthroderma uncinatum]KAF3491080.1 FAD dependent oxidoreductase superfamily protein [Arthroderma uncinatum]